MYAAVEWTWTGIAAVGVLVSLWSWKLAREDVKFLEENRFNGRRMIVAEGHRRRERMRTLIQSLGLYVGWYALGLPDPPGVNLNTATVCLMAMQFFVVLNTVSDLRDRFRLIAYWKNVDLSHVKERDEEVKGEV